ncbi:MAG TPA: AAA family ATPase [Vicinamibacterales bacterium]|jgi:general secretion pathway protein A|nr:AAA family ATPase [Vicinamibacterales bacterium]
MDSLMNLDDGLGCAGEPKRPRASSIQNTPAPPAQTSPAPPATVLPPVVRGPGQRPLLDLFPSAGELHPAAPAPLAPPRVNARAAPRPSTGSHDQAPTAYEQFYGLRERPFSLSSDPKFLYQSTAYDQVTQKMLAAIGHREPLVLLTGEMGAGKTMLCRALVEQLDRRTLTSVVTEPFSDVGGLIKTLLIDLGVVSRDEVAGGRMASATEGELRAALDEFLQTLASLQAFAVVIIDEAHALEAGVLNELQRLVSVDRSMQIVLVGQPALARLLDAGKRHASPLAKAVSLRCELGLLAEDEVGGYVMHRLRVAGTHPRVEFDDAAFTRLHAISGGNPRLLNLLCDRALAGGFADQASVIDEALVNSAAEDLDVAPPAPKGGIFGNLATVAMLLLLMLAGAAAGALTFHHDIEAILRGR